MDVLEALFTRRSIRRYTGEPISEEHLRLLLKAGFSAPSAHNRQPWHFVVVRNRYTLEEIARQHPMPKCSPRRDAALLSVGTGARRRG